MTMCAKSRNRGSRIGNVGLLSGCSLAASSGDLVRLIATRDRLVPLDEQDSFALRWIDLRLGEVRPPDSLLIGEQALTLVTGVVGDEALTLRPCHTRSRWRPSRRVDPPQGYSRRAWQGHHSSDTRG